MLDQETARALLHIADQADARVVFVGDRRQLPAVGRGGVLDMVAQWAPTQVELSAVHRFRTPDGAAGHRVRRPHPADPVRAWTPPRCSTTSSHGGHVKLWDSEADALAHLAVRNRAPAPRR